MNPQNNQQPNPQYSQQPDPQGQQPQPRQQFAGQPGQQPQPIQPQTPMYDQPVPGTQPQIVYMARPHEPQAPEISPATKKRHEESKKKYPYLNLSEGEFVLSAVQRHPIGLLGIWVAVGAIISVLIALLALLSAGGLETGAEGGTAVPVTILSIPIILISLLALIIGVVGTSIYNANKFFLTNESVIQQIQTSLFSKREQTVSLSNIEDASYTQEGILPHILGYGMIRLSTEGDETTYRFNYAANPKQTIATLNNAVEAFKNGRPVSGETDIQE